MTVVLLIFVGIDIHFSKHASSKIRKLIGNGSIKLLSYFFYSMNIWFCQTMNYMKICAQLMCWNIYNVFYIIWEYSHIHYHHWIFIFWVAFLQWHLFCTGILLYVENSLSVQATVWLYTVIIVNIVICIIYMLFNVCELNFLIKGHCIHVTFWLR